MCAKLKLIVYKAIYDLHTYGLLKAKVFENGKANISPIEIKIILITSIPAQIDEQNKS
jgi:hypothetical protein